MSKILLCLGTQKGEKVLRALLTGFPEKNFLVAVRKETGVAVSHEEAISSLAGDTVVSWREIRAGGERWIHERDVAAIICVGWNYMIPSEICEAVGREVVIAHDSLLPKYRGFAPLPTALINGEPEVGVTVLYAADEVDAGDILFQESLSVTSDDTIASLTERITPLYERGIISYLRGELTRTPQDHDQATYSIWRDDQDYWIDWNWSAEKIERSIRALGTPYAGARTLYENKVFTLTQATPVGDLNFEIRQTGKIHRLDAGRPIVVCGVGLLRIDEAEGLLPCTRLKGRFSLGTGSLD
jgi:methionyl-tRNA formyltransferase